MKPFGEVKSGRRSLFSLASLKVWRHYASNYHDQPFFYLRGGVLCRIWRAIQRHRERERQRTNERSEDEGWREGKHSQPLHGHLFFLSLSLSLHSAFHVVVSVCTEPTESPYKCHTWPDQSALVQALLYVSVCAFKCVCVPQRARGFWKEHGRSFLISLHPETQKEKNDCGSNCCKNSSNCSCCMICSVLSIWILIVLQTYGCIISIFSSITTLSPRLVLLLFRTWVG